MNKLEISAVPQRGLMSTVILTEMDSEFYIYESDQVIYLPFTISNNPCPGNITVVDTVYIPFLKSVTHRTWRYLVSGQLGLQDYIKSLCKDGYSPWNFVYTVDQYSFSSDLVSVIDAISWTHLGNNSSNIVMVYSLQPDIDKIKFEFLSPIFSDWEETWKEFEKVIKEYA